MMYLHAEKRSYQASILSIVHCNNKDEIYGKKMATTWGQVFLENPNNLVPR